MRVGGVGRRRSIIRGIVIGGVGVGGVRVGGVGVEVVLRASITMIGGIIMADRGGARVGVGGILMSEGTLRACHAMESCMESTTGRGRYGYVSRSIVLSVDTHLNDIRIDCRS